jgi:RHS repeat-associated protein
VGTLPTKRTFTGQIADATGLYFYNARYYSQTLGRFVSADTVVPGAGEPQAFHRYAFEAGGKRRSGDY